MNNPIELANKIKDWLIEIRRDFHKHPELAMEEVRTAKKIEEYLKEMGIEYKNNVASTGVVGIIKGSKPGKTVALRADIDALPIMEENDIEYKSTVEGKMHACGHDAHMTMLLGTAKILNDLRDELNGNIKLIFQPAEETVGGAEPMIAEGIMENPKVDAVFGLHVAPEIPVGEIGVKYGKMNASSDNIKIVVQGESTHGAYPHSGVDALLIASHVVVALQSIVSRNVDPRDSAVVTLGAIHGGQRENIVANRIEIIGTVRTLSSDTREKVIENIRRIVINVSESMGGKGELFIDPGYTALINHDDMVTLVKKNAEEMLGKDKVKVIKDPSLGVEDFAYFLEVTPGAYFRLGCGNAEKGTDYDLHHCRFNIDEDCLVIGTAIQVKNALKITNVK